MKRKKQQSIGNLQSITQYIIDILIILDYEPEYLDIYVEQVHVLREMVKIDNSYTAIQYYEMLTQHEETVDLGSRYEYLINMIILLIETKNLELLWFNTRL